MRDEREGERGERERIIGNGSGPQLPTREPPREGAALGHGSLHRRGISLTLYRFTNFFPLLGNYRGGAAPRQRVGGGGEGGGRRNGARTVWIPSPSVSRAPIVRSDQQQRKKKSPPHGLARAGPQGPRQQNRGDDDDDDDNDDDDNAMTSYFSPPSFRAALLPWCPIQCAVQGTKSYFATSNKVAAAGKGSATHGFWGPVEPFRTVEWGRGRGPKKTEKRGREARWRDDGCPVPKRADVKYWLFPVEK
ncbi:hypothetical protein Purlil1_5790 [Purpureocillium lilacinum]|uniref:Uncharacterized protein n=1 Tax=Purpureocillium lilacinum TaxID=33203 RepID=A0ABR0C088_PURLI|nr:hypothetical protein Purlil1_5790 [Purpureocillium lilacinum]